MTRAGRRVKEKSCVSEPSRYRAGDEGASESTCTMKELDRRPSRTFLLGKGVPSPHIFLSSLKGLLYFLLVS